MKFQDGNKLGKGGKRAGAGRKSNQVKANEAEAIRIFREKLAGNFSEFFRLCKKLCKGVKRKKFYPKGHPKEGDEYIEMEYDTATLRFLIERFVPPAKTAMDLNVRDTPEEWYRAIRAAKEAKAKK